MPGKKRKLIGAGRYRASGDNLPPLAPSSAASRREDYPQTKAPPVSTPRPQPLVAQWAITKQIPDSSADKLTTIASDNELDNDDARNKLSKRITSPHPITANRIKNERENRMITRDNDDEEDTLRRSSSMSKSRSRFDNDDDDKSKTTRSKGEEERYSRQRYDRNHEDDDNDRNETYPKRPSSSTRKPTTTSAGGGGGSSSRSHSKTNGNRNDDDD